MVICVNKEGEYNEQAVLGAAEQHHRQVEFDLAKCLAIVLEEVREAVQEDPLRIQ